MARNSFQNLKRFSQFNRTKYNWHVKVVRRAVCNLHTELGLKKKLSVVPEYVVHPYIIDLFLKKYGIAIEIDGGYHERRLEYDAHRDSFLEDLGIIILRFDNGMVDKYFPEVIQIIKSAILKRGENFVFDFYKICLCNRLPGNKNNVN